MNQIPPESSDETLRPHSYDGITEYDKRLPNWWLNTLYITIVFWVGYWSYYQWLHIGQTGAEVVSTAMAKIEADRLSVAQLDDASLWKMSLNADYVARGKAVFEANCVACHLPSMRGKAESPVAIGPDLTDTKWTHGGKPTQVHDLIMKGVLAKGMPTWGPVLGAKKVTDAVAYILSKHKEGEAIEVEVSAPPAPAP